MKPVCGARPTCPAILSQLTPGSTWSGQFERVGNQVHYISLQVGDQTYNVDTYYNNQIDWTLEEIDTAFQMDLPQPPISYNVWLDQVNLTAW